MNFVNPLVSIVIPVYNGENYLKEAVDSALAQTYQNIEIVVVNDGSSDGGKTREIALSYGDKIRYFEKENGGCASALNEGIRNARGDYFSWLSHDDRYLPEKIDSQVELVRKEKDLSAIVYSGYELIDQNSKRLYPVKPHQKLPPQQLCEPLLPLMRGLVHGCSLLIPMGFFKLYGLFDESLRSTQDYDLWFKFFRKARLIYDENAYVESRVHPDQGTHKIQNHIEECNDLWIGFLNQLTDAEMCKMQGTRGRFLYAQAKFLSETPYKRAAQTALAMAEESMGRILVSVIIPFYNRIDWTVEAIKSALSQTHNNIEVILVDDGSTEDVSAVRQFELDDPRVKYFRQDNQGVAAARNLALDHASGEYVAFLDSDDLFLPDKILTQLRYMESNELLFCHTSYDRIDADGNSIGTVSTESLSGNVLPAMITACTIAVPTVVVARTFVGSRRFPSGMHYGEDICMWLTLALDCEVGAMKESLTKVRVSGGNTSACPIKQANGLIGIAHFCLNDQRLSGYYPQIKSLLAVALRLLPSDTVEPERQIEPRLNTGSNLFFKFYYSLKYDGLESTFNRVKWFMRNR